jgi:hypothetical protein
MIINDLFEEQQSCPHCGGPMFSEMLMMEKKDACYYKVKASAKVWPSAYASGRLVQCRKKGADNYGNKSEGVAEKLGDNRPELGSKRDAGKSVRKWRSERGLDEVDAQNFVGGMTASYQARENQPIAEGCVVDYMEEVRS